MGAGPGAWSLASDYQHLPSVIIVMHSHCSLSYGSKLQDLNIRERVCMMLRTMTRKDEYKCFLPPLIKALLSLFIVSCNGHWTGPPLNTGLRRLSGVECNTVECKH